MKRDISIPEINCISVDWWY